MLKKEDGKIIGLIFEFLIIFLTICLFLLLMLYYFDIDLDNIVIDGFSIKYLKKVDDDKSIDDYIKNDLSLDDENINIPVKTENEFFYNQLDEYGKIIYNKIISNSDNLVSGNYVINFNNEFDSLLDNNGDEILKTSYKNAVDCIRYDRLDLFYIDFTKMYLKIETTTRGVSRSYKVFIEKGDNYDNYFINEIESQDELFSIMDKLKETRDNILNNVSGTGYQKILQIHNYLIDNLEYDQTNRAKNNDNIIGALIDGNVVCEGYAKAFKYLLDYLELPCILVIGNAENSMRANEKHMWNYVFINDEWYGVDVTWDDPIISDDGKLSNESRYKYFCRKSDFNDNHFSKGVISINGTEFEYPELAK